MEGGKINAYELLFLWKEIFCTYVMVAEFGVTLAIGKGHFLLCCYGSAEGGGLLRGNDYGDASDLQIKQKCKQINDKHKFNL